MGDLFPTYGTLRILAETACGSNSTTTVFSTLKLVDPLKTYDIYFKLS
jgi:hypothetical protein